MIRRFYVILLMSLLSITSLAYDFEYDGIYYNAISVHDLTCEVTYKDKTGEYSWYSPYAGDIVIPSIVNYSDKKFTVTSIGEHAFDKCSDLISVFIPNTVTSIGFAAFSGCNGLTSVNIPNPVTTITDYAFEGCSGLTSVTIPNSVTSIGNGVFERCSALTSVTIPNSVTSIGSGAFFYCTALTSLEIPSSVRSIELNTFHGCSSLTSVIIPNSVTSIGQAAFEGCHSLNSIEISNSVTEIKLDAFADCIGLISVVIGNSVGSIGTDAFKNCISLKEIKSFSVTPPRISSNTFEGVSKMDALVKVPEVSVASYKSANYWKSFWNIIALSNANEDEPINKKCEDPTIELESNNIVVKSSTEGSECYTSITSDDFKSVNGNQPISLTGIYNISSYAHAEGYLNSETVSAILVWGNPELQSDGVLSMEAKKSILIRTIDDNIVVSGLDFGDLIILYDISGRMIETVKATGHEQYIGSCLQKGEIYILKLGNQNVKVKM